MAHHSRGAALHSFSRYYEISELLLSKGAIVDPMWECKSPLHIAAQYGNARIVGLLLHHNAEENVLHLLPIEMLPTEEDKIRVNPNQLTQCSILVRCESKLCDSKPWLKEIAQEHHGASIRRKDF